MRYKFKIVDQSEEEDPVTCYQLRNSYEDREISASSRLSSRAETCADEFPAVWYGFGRDSDETCERYRNFFDEGLISRSGIGRLSEIAAYCASQYPIGWNGLSETPEEEDPVTCYLLRNNYTNSQISRYTTLSERASTCASEFAAVWHGFGHDSDETCARYRNFFDEGLISRSGIGRLSEIAVYCARNFPAGWNGTGSEPDDGDAETISATADSYPSTSDVITARLIKSPRGSNSHRSVQFVGNGMHNAAAISAYEVLIDDDGEVAVMLDISDRSRDGEILEFNAGDVINLEADDGAFEYDVFVARIWGDRDGYVMVDLAIQP